MLIGTRNPCMHAMIYDLRPTRGVPPPPQVRFDMSEFFATFCIITADQMPPPELQKDVVHMNSNVGFYDYTS